MNIQECIGKKIPSKTGHWFKIMAYADNYYMVRRKGCMPFVIREKELIKFIERNKF